MTLLLAAREGGLSIVYMESLSERSVRRDNP